MSEIHIDEIRRKHFNEAISALQKANYEWRSNPRLFTEYDLYAFLRRELQRCRDNKKSIKPKS